MPVELQLKDGYVAWLDDADRDLARLRWQPSFHKRSKTVYVKRLFTENGVQVSRLLHRIVLARMLDRPLKKGEEVDFRNGNGLDCRRENLRLATRADNCRNVARPKNNTSGYKGVYSAKGKWKAAVYEHGKSIHLGYFDTAEEAHQAYCKAAMELYGKFARLD